MGERRGTKGLELWCRRMTEGYPGVEINNMTTSWRDGLAFCAMIHHFRPDLIDFSKLNKNDVYQNNLMAFQIAEDHLGIPALLEPDDMVKFTVPDRLSIMTYLSQFYQTFVVAQGLPSRTVPKRPSIVGERPLVPTSSSNTPSKMSKPVIGMARREPCFKCSLPVVLAERFYLNGQLYHRTCFNCSLCNAQLSLCNYRETEIENQFCCETCPDEEPDCTHIKLSLSDEEKSASIKQYQETDDYYSDLFETALEDTEDNMLTAKYVSDADHTNAFVEARSRFIASQLEDSNEKIHVLPESPPNFLKLEKSPDLFKFLKSDDLDLVDSLKDISNNDSDLLNNSSLDCVSVSNLSDNDKNQQTTFSSSLDNITKDSAEDIIVISDTIEMSDATQEEDMTHEGESTSLHQTGSSYKPIETLVSAEIIENDTPNNSQSIIIITSDDSMKDNSKDISNSISNTSEEDFVETSKPQNGATYPEDLNPFGDDDEENDMSPNVSLNPFGDDDDFEDVPVSVDCRKKVSLGDISRIGPYLYMEHISVNPYESGKNQEPTAQSKKEKQYEMPVPSPRKERTSIGTPSPALRKLGLGCSSAFGSSTSLWSVHSSIEPGKRKKKQAPKPPSNNLSTPESGHSSLTSTPCTSAQHSPKSLAKSRKLKRAPQPPSFTPVVTKKEPLQISSLPILYDDQRLKPDMDNSDIEKEKVIKDEVNRNRQSQISTESQLPAIPFNYKLKRISKGPAPSRPIAEKRTIKPLPFQQIKNELDDIEIQMQGLEKQGVRLEELIREKCEGPGVDTDVPISPEVDCLILDLFEIVNEKNLLFRRQAELMYLRRQQRLEEEYADLEYQIRCLILVPEVNKTDSDKEREEELIKRLYDVVEQRNEIVECLEMDRVREAREDDSINNQLSKYSLPSTKGATVEEFSTKKKSKKFKFKGHKKVDIDKDIDECDPSPKKEKKKKMFSIF